jgi:hypothetical protein
MEEEDLTHLAEQDEKNLDGYFASPIGPEISFRFPSVVPQSDDENVVGPC